MTSHPEHPLEDPGPVVALSADLESSRKVAERTDLARQLEQVLEQVGRAFAEHWVAPLVSTRGLDELSAVLSRRAPLFDIVVAVNTALWPYRFRFAAADGALDIVGSSAGDMDGPAFHRAADGLARAHDAGLPLALDFAGSPRAALDLAEATALLHHTIMAGWTPQTAQAIQRQRLPGEDPRTQAEVARELGKTQQSVSAAQRRGRLRELLRAQEQLGAWLREQDR